MTDLQKSTSFETYNHLVSNRSSRYQRVFFTIDRMLKSDRIEARKSELFDMYQNGITLPVCIGDAMCII